MPRQLLILGAGGFAEELADLVADISGSELAGFIEGLDRHRCEEPLLGLPVHWVEDIGPLVGTCQAVCGVGGTSRAAFIRQVEAMGMRFTAVVHPTARVSRTVTVGDGAIVSAGAVIGTGVSIGRHALVNRGCLIGHHARIGDGAVLGPGVNIGGGADIGDAATLGIGAIVLDRRVVGAGAMVGAGTVVARHVTAHGALVGVRARPVRRPRREG